MEKLPKAIRVKNSPFRFVLFFICYSQKQKKSKKSKEKYICKVTLPLYELRVNINIFSIQIPKKKKNR